MTRFQHTFLGLDLGQRSDYSALAVIDLVETIGTRRNPVTFEFHRTQQFRLRAITRYPLGTPYTEIPAKVRHAAAQPPPGHFGPKVRSTLAVDAGGPGVPVVELLRKASLDCSLLPALITGGAAGSLLNGGIFSVPRKELVSLLRIALESGMLVFPADLPLRNELTTELAGLESAGGQSKHDDMALAIALALWATTKRQPGLLNRAA